MHDWIWVIVVIAAVAVLLVLALVGLRGRNRKSFETHSFPANYVDPYTRRIDEIERMFVSQPREAVAAARLMVDDMLTRMGYPVRMSNDERVRDLKQYSKERAERYALATSFKGEPNTEQLRRALQAHLSTARELLEGNAAGLGTGAQENSPSAGTELAG